jgi:phenylpyruvate tautomerase PptA (4-oxalocrotonate tautomerase family)
VRIASALTMCLLLHSCLYISETYSRSNKPLSIGFLAWLNNKRLAIRLRARPATKEINMPVIRVTYPAKALTDKQKETLAPLLIDAVMLQEVDPVTELARDATLIVFNEIPQKDSYMSKEPVWLVEAMVAAGFLNQKRRDAAHAAVSKAFVKVLGDDGSSIVLEDVRVSPKYLSHLWVLIIEIPEGSWGWAGRQTSALEIGHIIGSDKDPDRWSELKVNSAKLQGSRSS